MELHRSEDEQTRCDLASLLKQIIHRNSTEKKNTRTLTFRLQLLGLLGQKAPCISILCGSHMEEIPVSSFGGGSGEDTVKFHRMIVSRKTYSKLNAFVYLHVFAFCISEYSLNVVKVGIKAKIP
ncbi:hypothetical protein ACS0TY_007412 [Phlomoides rotata]